MIIVAFLLFALAQLNHGHGFKIEPKIVNGYISYPKQFPFYIFYRSARGADKKTLICAGALINDRWILTAAHCLQKKTELRVNAGIDENGNYFEEQIVPLSNQYAHPSYTNDSLENDIALIQLPSTLVHNPYAEPVKMPADCGENVYNKNVFAMGTGKIAFHEETRSTLLRYCNLTISSSSDHDEYSQSHDNSVKNAIILATPSHEKQCIYHGDSGGPLVLQKDNTLLGIIRSGNRFKLQIFTKIHFYFDWISHITGLNLPQCAT